MALKLADLLNEKNICQGQTLSNIFKKHKKHHCSFQTFAWWSIIGFLSFFYCWGSNKNMFRRSMVRFSLRQTISKEVRGGFQMRHGLVTNLCEDKVVVLKLSLSVPNYMRMIWEDFQCQHNPNCRQWRLLLQQKVRQMIVYNLGLSRIEVRLDFKFKKY